MTSLAIIKVMLSFIFRALRWADSQTSLATIKVMLSFIFRALRWAENQMCKKLTKEASELANSGKLEEALIAFKGIRQASPEIALPYLKQAQILISLGRYHECEAVGIDMIEKFPELPQGYFLLARI